MNKVQKIRRILLCVSVCLILVVVGLALRDKKKQIVIKTDTPAGASPVNGVALQNVAYSTTNKDNVKEWDLNARSAQYFQDEKKVVLEYPEINLYRPDNKTYRLKGSHGEFNTETKNIKMNGNIAGVMPDNTTIQTESFFYDNEKRLITTDDKIYIRRGTFAMEGVGMVVDLNREKLSILGKVKALGSK